MAKVLVIDDDLLFRQLLRMLVENAGHEVSEAADGEEALSVIADMSPDLVITDMDMPQMTGFELLRRLRADAKTTDLPVVVVSAHETSADRDEAYQLGCDAYVLKTLPPEILIERIMTVLSEGG